MRGLDDPCTPHPVAFNHPVLCSDGDEGLRCGWRPRMKPVIQPFSSVSTGLMPTKGSGRDLASGVLTASCSVRNVIKRNAGASCETSYYGFKSYTDTP